MRLAVLSSLLCLYAAVAACTEHPSYVVCRGEAYCTPPLTHDEAIHAAQLKRAWGDEQLYVRPGR
jgi:hypothetical protein